MIGKRLERRQQLLERRSSFWFGQGLDEAGAESLIEIAGPLFADAAFAAAQRGEPAVAQALAAEGRAKLMATALKLQDLDLDPAHRTRLNELRASIRDEIKAYASASGVARASALDRLAALRQALLELMQEANRSGGKAVRTSLPWPKPSSRRGRNRCACRNRRGQ